MEELVELDKLLNSERLSEDGPKNQSKLYLDWLIISKRMPMQRILRISLLITFKLIELQKDVEELTELMVELVHIYLAKLIFKYTQLKRSLMLKRRAKLDKLQKAKSLLDKIEMISIAAIKSLIILSSNNCSYTKAKNVFSLMKLIVLL